MKTQKELITKVARAHANYIIRMAGSNIWGLKKIEKMVKDIETWHTEHNTSLKSLETQINRYKYL